MKLKGTPPSVADYQRLWDLFNRGLSLQDVSGQLYRIDGITAELLREDDVVPEVEIDLTPIVQPHHEPVPLWLSDPTWEERRAYNRSQVWVQEMTRGVDHGGDRNTDRRP